jgi:6-phosphofructokinase 1
LTPSYAGVLKHAFLVILGLRLSKNYRVVILGHLQPGGSPTSADRILATQLGAYAVDIFLADGTGVMAGELAGKLCTTPLRETFTLKKPLEAYLLRIHSELSQ